MVGEEIAHMHRLLGSPGRIRIDAEPFLRRSVADDPNDLHVAIGAELDLENRIIPRLDDAPLQLVVIGDGNGEARLQGGGRIESP